MRKNYIFLGIFTASIALLSFKSNNNITSKAKYHQKNGNGKDGDYAGAPGDANCTQCHGGSTLSGAGVNTVAFLSGTTPVTTYVPGQAYTVTVNFANGADANGFQVVAKNSSGTTVGTVSIPTLASTIIRLTATGDRVTQKTAGTALTTWAFTWTAPATDAGTVTFYLATNGVTGNFGGGDDEVYLSQHPFGSAAGVEEFTKTDLEIGFNSNTNSFGGDAAINLVDINGKSVQFEQLGSVEKGENNFTVKLNKDLPKGIYVAHVNVNNKFVSKKIFID